MAALHLTLMHMTISVPKMWHAAGSCLQVESKLLLEAAAVFKARTMSYLCGLDLQMKGRCGSKVKGTGLNGCSPTQTLQGSAFIAVLQLWCFKETAQPRRLKRAPILLCLLHELAVHLQRQCSLLVCTHNKQ